MKFFLYLAFVLLLGSTVLAQNPVDLTLDRTTFSQGETVQVSIKTNLKLVTAPIIDNFKILDSIGSEVPVAKGFVKITNDHYYGYFDLPLQLKDGTYTIRLQDILYEKSENENELYQAETVINVQKKDGALSLRPGIVSKRIQRLEQPGFQFVLSNRGTKDLNLQFSTDADFITLNEPSYTLKTDQVYTLTVNTNVVGKTENTFSGNLLINYEDTRYVVPILLKREEAPETEQPTVAPAGTPVQEDASEESGLSFILSVNTLNETLKKSQTVQGTFPLKNNGDTTYTNLRISLTGNLAQVITLNQVSIPTLQPGETFTLTASFNKDKNLEKTHEGELKVESEEGASISLPITLRPETTQQTQTTLPQEVFAVDEPEVKETNSAWWIVLIAAILALAGLGIYIFKKKPKENPFPFKP